MIDLTQAKQMLEKRDERRKEEGKEGDLKWYSLPEDGTVKTRILPPVGEMKLPGILIYKHYNIPNSENITCFKTWDLECPICKMLEDYDGRLDISDWKNVGRSFMNVLVLTDKKYDPTIPHILGGSDYNFYWLLENVLNPEVGDITDPKTGSTVEFKRKTHKGAFERIVARLQTPIADSTEKIDAILKMCSDLSKIWRTPDDEYYKMAIQSATNLKQLIESRLLSLGDNGNVGQDTTGKKTETKAADKPKGAPDCFGTKEHDPNAKKCMICPQEFFCAEKTK